MTEFTQLTQLGKTPKNASERFIYENTNLIYVDEAYYDFIISNDELIEFYSEEKIIDIKIEVLSSQESEKGPKIKFKVRRGKWKKFPGSDFIVTLDDYNIFYGLSYRINEHLEKTLEQRTLELSYRPLSKGLVYTERLTSDLEKMRLLKSILKDQVNELENLIKLNYKYLYQNMRIKKIDLLGIEPGFHPCHGYVMPLYDRPVYA